MGNTRIADEATGAGFSLVSLGSVRCQQRNSGIVAGTIRCKASRRMLELSNRRALLLRIG
jgi:hypothetical protein